MNGEKMGISLRWSPPPPGYGFTKHAQCGFTQEKVERVFAELFEQLREPRVLNLNASQLSPAVSLAVKSM